MSSKPRKGPAATPQLRELESRSCRRCGVEAGRQCVTASGTGAPWPHAERLNDAGSPTRFIEGTNLTVYPPLSSAAMNTNVVDRFNAWIADPETPPEPTLEDAFREGFVQSFEFVSGQLRQRDPE